MKVLKYYAKLNSPFISISTLSPEEVNMIAKQKFEDAIFTNIVTVIWHSDGVAK